MPVALDTVNAEGFRVDLIRPDDGEISGRATMGEAIDDLHAARIEGLQWLVNAPRFEAVAIADDGAPVRLVTPDPRAFAIHKLWLSERADRDPIKRPRDRRQAQVCAALSRTYLGLSFEARDLEALPAELPSRMAEAF